MTSSLADRPLKAGSRRLPAWSANHWLAVWYAAWFGFYAWAGGAAWHFFVAGEQALSDLDDPVRGGIHLYAALPQIQIGPVALFIAWLLSPFGTHVSLALAQLLGAAAGVAVLLLVRRIAAETRPDLGTPEITRRTQLAAVVATPVWLNLAVSSVHLEDVLAILCATAAVLTVVRQRPIATGVLLGLAVDCKPWAVPFAAILLLIPGRARLTGAAVFVTTIAACWLPFLVLDPHTMNGVATRMVLDPGTNIYYTGSLVAGAALWDVAGSSQRLPGWTAATAISLYGGRHAYLPPSTNGWFLILVFAAVLLLIVVRPARVAGRAIPALSRGHTGPHNAARVSNTKGDR